MNATMRATVGILAALALFGCAATSPNSKPAAAAVAANDPNCLTQTGSNIPHGKGKCVGYGRSYSSEDIDRTGATSAGAALRLLDPSLTVHQ
jgi:hypothetical protein